MDATLLEKTNSEEIKRYLSFGKKYTVNTIDSLPEFNNKSYLSKIIIGISCSSLILGIYIIINKSYYFNYKFNLLYYYIIIYTFGLFVLFFFFFIITLILKLIKKCFKSKNNDNINTIKLIEEKEILLDENYNDNILLNEIDNIDNIEIIPYTLSICIFLGIILYVVGFPFSFYLIYLFIKYHFYFFIICLFIFINDISGAIFLFILIAFIRNKTPNSLRKMSFYYDEDNLMAAYNEVKDAINLAK